MQCTQMMKAMKQQKLEMWQFAKEGARYRSWKKQEMHSFP